MRIYTVGHSNLDFDDFTADILRARSDTRDVDDGLPLPGIDLPFIGSEESETDPEESPEETTPEETTPEETTPEETTPEETPTPIPPGEGTPGTDQSPVGPSDPPPPSRLRPEIPIWLSLLFIAATVAVATIASLLKTRKDARGDALPVARHDAR